MTIPDAGWAARLELVFGTDARGRTRLLHNRHHGPLRLIRALPAADGACEAVIVHPPGGLVGGDSLEIDIEAGEGTSLLCTTPGAQKWYRSTGAAALARTRLAAGADAKVSWLPQPAIVFDGARAEQVVEFDLASSTRFVGWECLILGRQAMGERFTRGSLAQRLVLRIDGRPVWTETSRAAAGDRLFASPLGWRGHCVCASVLAAGPMPASLCERWRAVLAEAQSGLGSFSAAATQPAPGLTLARLLGDDSETVMAVARQLWLAARNGFGEHEPIAPRIWAT